MSADAFLMHVQRINPFAAQLFRSDGLDAFLDAAERLIERVVRRMEASRGTYRKLSEPDLSNLMKDLLGELVPAAAEAHQNGHVDLTIFHPNGLDFRHITECKIWDGQEWHRAGMHQLLDYATGREGRTLCLAFFVKTKGMVAMLKRLRVELDAGGVPPVLRPCGDHPFLAGAFVSFHVHPSGAELGIVHLGCHLYEPTRPAAEPRTPGHERETTEPVDTP